MLGRSTTIKIFILSITQRRILKSDLVIVDRKQLQDALIPKLMQQELKQTENQRDKPFANLESHQINNMEEQTNVSLALAASHHHRIDESHLRETYIFFITS
jgi:hypothetical protein